MASSKKTVYSAQCQAITALGLFGGTFYRGIFSSFMRDHRVIKARFCGM
jgi:hypothetical protein